MSIKNYRFNKTTNGLLHIEVERAVSYTEKPKDNIVDKAILGFIRLLDEKGENYYPEVLELCEWAGISYDTFRQSIQGGVNGLMCIVEECVVCRFAEAVEKSNGSFSGALHDGLVSLFHISSVSEYNRTKTTNFDINLRTKFCVRKCAPGFWVTVTECLYPLIVDNFLANNPDSGFIPDKVKSEIYRQFTYSFQYIVSIMVEENLEKYESISSRNDRLRLYENYLKKRIINIVRNDMECRYFDSGTLGQIMNGIHKDEYD